MGIRFIIGPAGAGKTKYIVDSVSDCLLSRAKGVYCPPLLVIVPDQATFQLESSILKDGKVRGFTDLHILGFRRLALQVLDEVGGYSLPFITRIGRSMAVQSILWQCKDKLMVYSPMTDYPGFRETLIRTFSEFSAYGVTPDDLVTELGEDAKNVPFLSEKLSDIRLIYSEYRKFVANKFLDPDDYLRLATPRIGESDLVKGSIVWIDGFSGFTPAEYEMIGEIMQTASQVNLALCMDREEIQHKAKETSLFHPVREIYDKVMGLSVERGIRVEGTLFLGEDGVLPRFQNDDLLKVELAFRNRDRSSRRLGALSQSLAERSSQAHGDADSMSGSNGVFVVTAANPRAEIEFVAREITKLVRDEGLAFRDITVEMRDLGQHRDLIKMVFNDHDIPFFLDEKSSLSHHPLAELIRSAFDVVISDFSFDAVFRYLKTDLVPCDRASIDKLENFVLASGIRGKTWLDPEPWRYSRGFLPSFKEEDLEVHDDDDLDSVRKQAMIGLGEFYAELKNTHPAKNDKAEINSPEEALTAKRISMAVYDLLMKLDVPATLAKWQDECEASGDLMAALEHAGIWDKTIEILEQAVEILKDHPCDVTTYALLIDAGLQDIRLGAIPLSLDQVLVGGLERTRQPECAVTFLLGAVEGEIPKKQGEDGVFTDKDREALWKTGINLEPASRVKQFHEQYLVYVALTRPAKRLYISYSLGDRDGKALFPSPVIRWLKDTVSVCERYVSFDPPGTIEEDLDYLVPASVWGLTARRMSLVRHGSAPGPVWQEAYRWMLEPSRMEKAKKILSSLGFSNVVPPLERPLAEELYGKPLRTSVSRLERFQTCPFQHFARDGLGLKEREVFSLDPAKAGTFYHEAMKEFAARIMSESVPIESLEDSDATRIMAKIVEEMVPKVQNELFLSSFRYRHVSRSLCSTLTRSAHLFLQHAKRGDFRPIAVEVPFGLGGEIPPLSLNISEDDQVLVRGLIDRIDAARMGDDVFLRVVDYKSGRDKLDLTDVYYGLSLQLLVYLAAALSLWEKIVNSRHLLGLCDGDGLEIRGLSNDVQPAGALYMPIRDPFIRTDGPRDRESALEQVRKELRMTGIVIDDLNVIRLMDKTTSLGQSDLVNVQFTKQGVSANSPVASYDQMRALLDYVMRKITAISEEIVSGRIDISPFLKNKVRGCKYCPFEPFCVFDVLLEGNEYRVLRNIPKDAIWGLIEDYGKGGND